MSATPAHSYTLEIFSDQHLVRDLTKGVLHTIFFHRYFPSIRPSLYTPSSSSGTAAPRTASATDTTLPIPLPCILDPPEIAAAIDSSVAELMSQLNTSSGPGNVPPGGTRSQIVVQFFERKRRKTGYTGGWLGRLGGGGAQTDEEVCWEEWCLKVVVARPRSEAGKLGSLSVRRKMPWANHEINRSNQGQAGYGIEPTKNSAEDRGFGQQREGSHTSHNDERAESIPLQNGCKSEAAAESRKGSRRLELIITEVRARPCTAPGESRTPHQLLIIVIPSLSSSSSTHSTCSVSRPVHFAKASRLHISTLRARRRT